MAVVSNGTTLIDNGTLDAGVPTGSLILLSTQTASASANISFTTGLDSTYSSYVFKFINIHPATEYSTFQFNLSTDGGSNYNVTKTSAVFRAYHKENDAVTNLSYSTTEDLAQATSYQPLSVIGNGADESVSGTLTLYNPSSTVHVKHFVSANNSTFVNVGEDGTPSYTYNNYIAGYGNTTSAIDAVQFKFASGNIDDGIIKLYGVK